MMWLMSNWRLAAVLAAMLAMSWLGWTVRGWQEDAEELAEQRGADKAIKASMERESNIASTLETRLQQLRANERVIEREKIKVVDRPVYSVSCLDADGVRLINAAKAGAPAKPAD